MKTPKEMKTQTTTADIKIIDNDVLRRAITKLSPEDLELSFSHLAEDQVFASDRIDNEQEIERLRLKLKNLNLLAMIEPTKSRQAEHSMIVAEMLKLEVENLLNGYGLDQVIKEIAKQGAAETSPEDDEETIAEFTSAIQEARKQEAE